MFDGERTIWIDPFSGGEYPLDHLDSFITSFEIKFSPEESVTPVYARVNFSYHCYTRTKTEEDDDKYIVGKDKKREGM